MEVGPQNHSRDGLSVPNSKNSSANGPSGPPQTNRPGLSLTMPR